ncbi:MAG: DUF3422 domain-containing protein [Kangiellaceae bacterium]|nr:DUF3422 domain-containing protein [Kangiellaceae bacterium]MCW8998948.1 DUF3422 domain-containing protein [Kangiellaceae bacterium]
MYRFQEDMLEQLRNEIHARSFPVCKSPVIILSQSFLLQSKSERQTHLLTAESITKLDGARLVFRDSNRCVVRFAEVEVRIDLYREYVTYTQIHNEPKLSGFNLERIEINKPIEAIEFCGQLLSSIRIIVVEPQSTAVSKKDLFSAFQDNQIISSCVAHGAANVWSSFCQDDEGGITVLVEDISMGPRRTGRLIQRLVDIENYRMLALLSLPLAKLTLKKVNHLDRRLSELVASMKQDSGIEEEQLVLKQIFRLTARHEKIRTTTKKRFESARFYQAQLEERFVELDDVQVKGYQTLSSFYKRRMKPAINTCLLAENALKNFSSHLRRVTELLRTKISVNLEQQNNTILENLATQSRRQFRLQHMVEGLSIIAISYYAISLLAYWIKSLSKGGYLDKPELLISLLIPLVIVSVWKATSKMKKQVMAE